MSNRKVKISYAWVTVAEIIDAMVAMSPAERTEIFDAIKYNDIFCPECGMGDREVPNPHCHCQNED